MKFQNSEVLARLFEQFITMVES